MPLFGRKHEATPTQPAPVTTTSHHRQTTQTSSPRTGGGLFHRRRSSSSLSSSDLEHNPAGRRSSRLSKSGGGMGGLFSRGSTAHEDPSIMAARERVQAAERAERDADFALQQARNSVRDAREHVRRLELEAEAEAKAAKMKSAQARDLNRRAKPLGSKF
ncbi:hypothetical protein LTR64_002017 [Lithohypha guttulata]|uniref:uncharacterized protein n=1 Tax=Lithohypha guttulata TaxID=1690604 RepID=UPI002DDF157B|nr:hypothetical protein LTR51_007876 [Lithohypha guttulata]